mmetsp:Transcript_14106/g.20775  ORF Transcript_14106/g.20775 Transcript_14106/m.20775 type:complete len:231 (-) Transcript_14106:311-1003(-)
MAVVVLVQPSQLSCLLLFLAPLLLFLLLFLLFLAVHLFFPSIGLLLFALGLASQCPRVGLLQDQLAALRGALGGKHHEGGVAQLALGPDVQVGPVLQHGLDGARVLQGAGPVQGGEERRPVLLRVLHALGHKEGRLDHGRQCLHLRLRYSGCKTRVSSVLLGLGSFDSRCGQLRRRGRQAAVLRRWCFRKLWGFLGRRGHGVLWAASGLGTRRCHRCGSWLLSLFHWLAQ